MLVHLLTLFFKSTHVKPKVKPLLAIYCALR